jgi:hypothetical protein
MGNRAYIVFDTNWPEQKPKGSDALPAVYVHWNGGPESVYTFLAYTKEVCRAGDKEYTPARFVQIVGNYFAGNLSVGLTAVKREDIVELSSVGDNGVYVVDSDTLEVTERHFENYIDLDAPEGTPWKEGVTFKKEFRSLTPTQIAGEKEAALVDTTDGFTQPSFVFKGLREVNDAFFLKQYDQKVQVKITGKTTVKKAKKPKAPALRLVQ